MGPDTTPAPLTTRSNRTASQHTPISHRSTTSAAITDYGYMTTYRGTVSGFAPRTESPVLRKRTTLVWDFRIERPGERRVAVEMRAKYYRGGSINNGDVVELDGQTRPNGVVVTNCVRNLTASTVVRGHKYNLIVSIITAVKLMALIAFLAAVAVGVMIVRHHMGS